MQGASLDGSVAVVIGGGGGIGSACARTLAEAGAQVAVVDVSKAAAQATCAAIGGSAWVADVADETSLAATAAQIEKSVGAVDILVNAAAVFQAPLPALRLGVRRWDELVAVTLRGTYLACLAFGERMIERRRGVIVNLASVAGMRSLPLHGYGPAKAAVISLSQSLAAEWGCAGVRVNAVSPGFTHTEGLEAAIRSDQSFESGILRGTPLARLVEPREVAAAVVFLASPCASAVTGINLPVDCGWLAGESWQPYGGLPTAQFGSPSAAPVRVLE